MVPEFPRDVFVYNSHLIGRIGVECLLERVAGWCFFFGGHGETDGKAQHSKKFIWFLDCSSPHASYF